MAQSHDIIIIGSGLVGLSNALLLSQHPAFRIAILDAKQPQASWNPRDYDPRVYAITPASQKILSKIGVWPSIQSKRLSPFTHMQVWDQQGGGELVFDHASLHVPALGYIVEENLLRLALLEKAKACPQIEFLCPLTLSGIQEQPDCMELQTLENITLQSRLVIGADGAQSWVREQAGIALQMQPYQHTSLIAQVRTEKPHQRTARQVFLSSAQFPPGPLAFLPLQEEHECSIVWSTLPEEADKLLALDEFEFAKILGAAFDLRLGEILSVSKRQAFPLYERHVENYVKSRLALIGDAAHTLHPLAGQGVNLGLADAACLARVIIEKAKKGRDYASVANLRPYERERKGDNLIMLSAVKLLKDLFTSENKSLKMMRSQGLSVINQFSFLKSFFARHAMGTPA